MAHNMSWNYNHCRWRTLHAKNCILLLCTFLLLLPSIESFQPSSRQVNTRKQHQITTKYQVASTQQPRCYAKKSFTRNHVIAFLQQDNSSDLDDEPAEADIDKFRSLMGNLYLGAGIAHAADCLVGPSALIVSAGSPPFQELPVQGQALVGIWCLAGPIAFWFARIGPTTTTKGDHDESSLNAADVGLILYGVIEVFGSYFLPDRSSFLNAIVVQGIVWAAWLYSNRNTDKLSTM